MTLFFAGGILSVKLWVCSPSREPVIAEVVASEAITVYRKDPVVDAADAAVLHSNEAGPFSVAEKSLFLL